MSLVPADDIGGNFTLNFHNQNSDNDILKPEKFRHQTQQIYRQPCDKCGPLHL